MATTTLGLGTKEMELRLLALDFAKLRATDPRAEAQLAASLGLVGQQHPLLVVAREDGVHVVIDGYRRVRALRLLDRDTAVVLVLGESEAEAPAYCHRLATGRRRSALEEGWLVRELCEGIGRTLAQIAVSLDRSKSWVSRRLGIATALPAEVETAVRDGLVPPHGAMRSLLPLARANGAHAKQLVVSLGRERLTTRQLATLWIAYRGGDDEQRGRIVAPPQLLLRAQDAHEGNVTEAALVRSVNAATKALDRAHTGLSAARAGDPDIGTSPRVRRAIGRAREAALALAKEEV